ncbi:MAG: hypothetical protein AAFY29_22535 [Pseudomonadota bacterium]
MPKEKSSDSPPKKIRRAVTTIEDGIHTPGVAGFAEKAVAPKKATKKQTVKASVKQAAASKKPSQHAPPKKAVRKKRPMKTRSKPTNKQAVATATVTAGSVCSNVRAISNSAGIVLTREVLQQLQVDKGDPVFLTPTADGYRLSTHNLNSSDSWHSRNKHLSAAATRLRNSRSDGTAVAGPGLARGR